MKNFLKINVSHKPVYLEFKTTLSFFEIFKKIENFYKNCFLFESLGSDQNNNNRYSLIGFNPSLVIAAKNKVLKIHATTSLVPLNRID